MKKTIHTTLLILAIWLAMIDSACTSAPTQASEVPIQANTVSQPVKLPEATQPPSTEGLLSVEDVEKLAGFDVIEPAYLPSGVSYQTAVFQNSPKPDSDSAVQARPRTIWRNGCFLSDHSGKNYAEHLPI